MATGDIVRELLRSVLRAAGLGTAVSAGRSLLSAAPLGPNCREPYVQGITATSAVIVWMSREPSTGVVKYGKAPGRQCRRTVRAGHLPHCPRGRGHQLFLRRGRQQRWRGQGGTVFDRFDSIYRAE